MSEAKGMDIIMKLKVNKRLSILLTLGAICLFLLGFIGFITSHSMVGDHIGKYYNQQPLNDISGIVVDSYENIYIGVGEAGSIQVYDRSGDFQYGFSFPTAGGISSIFGIEQDKIHVIAARTHNYYVFDNGELVYSEEKIDTKRSQELQTQYHMIRDDSYDTNNKIYQVLLFNDVSIKDKLNGKVERIHLNAPIWPFHPLVFWLIGVTGIALLFALYPKFFISIFKSVRSKK